MGTEQLDLVVHPQDSLGGSGHGREVRGGRIRRPRNPRPPHRSSGEAARATEGTLPARPEHFQRLERLYHAAPVNRYFAPRIRISEGEAEVRILLREDFHHAFGAVHGSICFKALDDAAFFAVQSVVEDVFVVTASFDLHFLRPVSEGEIVAFGRLLHRASRRHLADARVEGPDGRVLARGTGTFMPSGVAIPR